jgi:hypothetical protein
LANYVMHEPGEAKIDAEAQTCAYQEPEDLCAHTASP